MVDWNESYNWTHDDYAHAIQTAKSENKSYVNLDTEHCSDANEKDLVRWAQEDGYSAEINHGSECVKIYLEATT